MNYNSLPFARQILHTYYHLADMLPIDGHIENISLIHNPVFCGRISSFFFVGYRLRSRRWECLSHTREHQVFRISERQPWNWTWQTGDWDHYRGSAFSIFANDCITFGVDWLTCNFSVDSHCFPPTPSPPITESSQIPWIDTCIAFAQTGRVRTNC